uniref:Uncharacterized protein n=1 Tax=Heterorhabditis bacteriophora TaxID=37862 RepID=A0A1I7WA30_HETBA
MIHWSRVVQHEVEAIIQFPICLPQKTLFPSIVSNLRQQSHCYQNSEIEILTITVERLQMILAANEK